MKLTELLIKVGLMEAPVPRSAPSAEASTPHVTRSVKLDDLREGRSTDVLEPPASIIERLDTPGGEHGWTVRKAMGMLKDVGVDLMTRAEKRQHLLALMQQAGVEPESLVLSAQALDSCLDNQEAAYEAQLRALDPEIAELRRKIENLERQRGERARALEVWRASKHELENELEAFARLLVDVDGR